MRSFGHGSENINDEKMRGGVGGDSKSHFYHLYWKGSGGFFDGFEEVVDGLVWILNEDPHFKRLDVVLDDLGSLYYLKGNFRRSEYYYRQLVTRFKKSPLRFKGYEYIGRSMMMRGDHEKLRGVLGKILKEGVGGRKRGFEKRGFERGIYELLGQSYFYNGDLKEGIAIYDRMEERVSFDSSSLYILLMIYMDLRREREGLKYGVKLLEEYPKSLEALYLKKNHFDLMEKMENMKKMKNMRKRRSGNGVMEVLDMSGEYELQVGVFREEENAKWIEDRLGKRNMRKRRIEVQMRGQTYYKVMVVGIKSKEELKEAKEKLEGMGIQFLVKKKDDLILKKSK